MSGVGKRVGFIGLGKMGMPMARHLLNAGFDVVGVDPDEGRRAEATDAGVTIVDSAAAVREASDVVLVLVGFDHQAREVCLGPEGLAGAAGGARDVLMCSTIQPETSTEVGAALEAMGLRYGDATMCRAEHAAVDGTLLLLFGGEEALLSDWSSMLGAFSTDIVHVGGIGSGQIAKMINNILLWIAVIGNQEALRFASALGLRQDRLVEALLLSSGANWALETWGKARPMPWAEDDMAMCIDLADTTGWSMPLTGLVRELMKDVKADKRRHVPGGPSASMQTFVDVMTERALAERAAGQ